MSLGRGRGRERERSEAMVFWRLRWMLRRIGGLFAVLREGYDGFWGCLSAIDGVGVRW